MQDSIDRISFNSSLVRLGVTEIICEVVTSLFQFQLGAIGSGEGVNKLVPVFQFQFQLGAIGSQSN